jgi:hypothetical protein
MAGRDTVAEELSAVLTVALPAAERDPSIAQPGA